MKDYNFSFEVFLIFRRETVEMIDSPALRHCTTTVAYSLMTNTSYKKNSQIPSVNAFSNEFSFFLNDKIDFVRNMKYV